MQKGIISESKLLKISLISSFVLFVGVGVLLKYSTDFFSKILGTTLSFFGPFYLYFGFGVVVLFTSLAFFPFSKKRLGKEEPQISWFSWIAMLFSTGMGPGLMLRAVQEPSYYFLNPPVEHHVHNSADYALAYTFFHWGFTPWAFYGLFGLLVGYYLNKPGHSIRISSFFSSIELSKSAKTIIDSTVILCTIVGLVASLGLGGKQISEGIKLVLSISGTNYLILFVVIALVAVGTISAFSGLNKSIKYLSNFNIGLMLFFLIFVGLQSDFLLLAKHFTVSMKIYLSEFVGMSLNIGRQKVNESFLVDWTYFYWAFWLAWVPFTGIFIARTSQGRSIRSFIIGTMLIPAIGTFFWFTAFGSVLFSPSQESSLLNHSYDSIYSSFYIFLEQFPLGLILKPMALLLIITFLITSVDSAIFVLSMFTDKGSLNPKKSHRVIWGSTIGILTSLLLIVGKDSLLQATSQLLILFAIPFSLLYLLMIMLFITDIFRNSGFFNR